MRLILTLPKPTGNLKYSLVMLTRERHRRSGTAFRSLRLAAVLTVVGSRAVAGSVLPGNEWFEVAPLPGPRAFHMTAFAATDSGPRLYAVGGQRSPSDTMERLCLEYSPQSNSWRQRTALSQRRGLGQAFVMNGNVWVFGGCATFGTGLASVEVYDPNTNIWTAGPNMPQGLYDFGAVVWRDSFVFVLGGGSWHPSLPPVDTVRLFDPATSTWYPATPLPVPLGAMACGIKGDTILLATGWTDSGPANRAWRGVINPVSPTAITWSELDTLPGSRRCRAACGVANNELFVIGGLALDTAAELVPAPSSLDLHPSGLSALPDVWSLSAGSGGWSGRAAKPHAVSCVYGTGSDATSRIYVPGGYPGTAPYLQTTEYLDLSSYNHDVGVAGIISPAGRLVPGDTCPVSVLLRNFGTVAETLNAHIAVVDSVSQTPAFVGDTSISVAPDSSTTVGFGTFVPVEQTVFHATAFVTLAGDENPDNDTSQARSRTTLGSDPDGFGYVYESTQEPDTVTFSWFDPSGGTMIDNWDPNPDEGTSRRILPFEFRFYDGLTNRLYICTNGYLQSSDNTAGLNFPLPYEGITDIIAPFWDDLSLRDSGQVYENSTSDRAVYTWVDARRAQPDTGRLTFQVILERDGDIRFNYLRVTADVASSTVGIQGDDGSWNWYLEYVYNADPLEHVPADSTSIVFHPPPVGIAEQENSGFRVTGLQVPSVCRGPVRITVSVDVRSVQVFDVAGSLVRTLVTPRPPLSPPHSLSWDRRDRQGRPVPAGAYFLRATSPCGSLTGKLILLD
jgi:hypothetical protein